MCFLSPSSPSPHRSIPFTTCTALKQPVSVFPNFFFFLHTPSCPFFAFSLCLLPPPFLYFLQSLQSVQANLGLNRSAASPACVVPAVAPVLFTKWSLNYRGWGVGVWGYSPESSFHLCNVVYRHANAVAVHPQTAAAHLLTPFLAPQLTHFSHTPLGRALFFSLSQPPSLVFTLPCRWATAILHIRLEKLVSEAISCHDVSWEVVEGVLGSDSGLGRTTVPH